MTIMIPSDLKIYEFMNIHILYPVGVEDGQHNSGLDHYNGYLHAMVYWYVVASNISPSTQYVYYYICDIIPIL